MDKIATLLHLTIAVVLTVLYTTETTIKNEIFYSAIVVYTLMIIVARIQYKDIVKLKGDDL